MKKKVKVSKVSKKAVSHSAVKKKVVGADKKKDLGENAVGHFVRTGIEGFDALFNGSDGIPGGSAVLVEGGPGSGKTIFCLSAAFNMCKRGKKCLYMSFEEPEEKLLQHMKNFNWKVEEFMQKDILRIKRFDAIDVSRSIEALLSAAKKELLIEIDPVFFPSDFKPDFVVIDSLTSIASAFSGQENRFRIYMEQLFRYLEKYNITSFLIREVSSPSHIGTTFKEQGEAVSFLSDGIIVLYNVIYESGERKFALEILKMRGADFKKRIVEMEIEDKKGLIINPEKILKKDSLNVDFQLT